MFCQVIILLEIRYFTEQLELAVGAFDLFQAEQQSVVERVGLELVVRGPSYHKLFNYV